MTEPATPEPTRDDESRFGPYANQCDVCGAVLGVEQKPKHIAWHRRMEDGVVVVQNQRM